MQKEFVVTGKALKQKCLTDTRLKLWSWCWNDEIYDDERIEIPLNTIQDDKLYTFEREKGLDIEIAEVIICDDIDDFSKNL